MSVASWIVEEHPFFRELRAHLHEVIRSDRITSLDDLVVRARRPVRTVLLMLGDLIHRGQVRADSDGITVNGGEVLRKPMRPNDRIGLEDSRLTDLAERYQEVAARREIPALLWGQRRLTPSSAVERGLYVMGWMERARGTVVFLGDDDLVSPFVAAGAPSWDVYVVDIDAAVLASAERAAAGLGAKLHVRHADLSQALLEHDGNCDIAVSDPFPSADGSFEHVFWSHAARILQPGGISITTINPSHKPPGYGDPALVRQQELGLALLDLRADFGRYESFDFEFTSYEQEILDKHGLFSTISQTKSLMAARKILASKDESKLKGNNFDFTDWTAATMGHYLTRQAGLTEQRAIAADRGIGDVPDHPKDVRQRGLNVELILPPELRTRALEHTGEAATAWPETLAKLRLSPEDGEIDELLRLSNEANLRTEGPHVRLGLAIRALESWERQRLDRGREE